MTSAINPRILKVLMASAFYWAFLFLLYWSNVLQISITPESGMFYMKGAAFLGSTLMLGFIFATKKASGVSVNNKALSLIPFVLTSLAPIASLLHAEGAVISWEVGLVAWFLTGAGLALLLVSIGRAFFLESNEDMHLISFISVFISCLICVFITFMQFGKAASAIIMIALCWMCYFIWLCGHDAFAKETAEVESARMNLHEADKSIKHRFMLFLFQLCFYSAAFAFALMTTISLPEAGFSVGYIWFGAFFAGILIMVYSMWLNRFCDVEQIQWALLAITVVGLVFLSFTTFAIEWRYVSCTILMFSFTAYDMLSLSQLVSLINSSNLSATKYFALGRFGNAAGMFLGWALAAVVLVLGGSNTGNAIQIIAGILIVVVVGIITLFSSRGKFAETVYGNDAEKDRKTGAWMNSCEFICKKYRLSARERDVLLMYAKGRDVNYISEVLFLSNHTVKSHVYHVFQKLNIHSQQDLISMVEQHSRAIRGKSPVL